MDPEVIEIPPPVPYSFKSNKKKQVKHKINLVIFFLKNNSFRLPLTYSRKKII